MLPLPSLTEPTCDSSPIHSIWPPRPFHHSLHMYGARLHSRCQSFPESLRLPLGQRKVIQILPRKCLGVTAHGHWGTSRELLSRPRPRQGHLAAATHEEAALPSHVICKALCDLGRSERGTGCSTKSQAGVVLISIHSTPIARADQQIEPHLGRGAYCCHMLL